MYLCVHSVDIIKNIIHLILARSIFGEIVEYFFSSRKREASVSSYSLSLGMASSRCYREV